MNDFIEKIAESFEDELKKIALAKQSTLGKAVPTLLAGAAGWEMLRRANQDRRNGKMMRLQQNQGF